MIFLFPALFIAWKFTHKTKWRSPEDVDLFSDKADIDEYERQFVPVPPRYIYAHCLLFDTIVRVFDYILVLIRPSQKCFHEILEYNILLISWWFNVWIIACFITFLVDGVFHRVRSIF